MTATSTITLAAKLEDLAGRVANLRESAHEELPASVHRALEMAMRGNWHGRRYAEIHADNLRVILGAIHDHLEEVQSALADARAVIQSAELKSAGPLDLSRTGIEADARR